MIVSVESRCHLMTKVTLDIVDIWWRYSDHAYLVRSDSTRSTVVTHHQLANGVLNDEASRLSQDGSPQKRKSSEVITWYGFNFLVMCASYLTTEILLFYLSRKLISEGFTNLTLFHMEILCLTICAQRGDSTVCLTVTAGFTASAFESFTNVCPSPRFQPSDAC